MKVVLKTNYEATAARTVDIKAKKKELTELRKQRKALMSEENKAMRKRVSLDKKIKALEVVIHRAGGEMESKPRPKVKPSNRQVVKSSKVTKLNTAHTKDSEVGTPIQVAKMLSGLFGFRILKEHKDKTHYTFTVDKLPMNSRTEKAMNSQGFVLTDEFEEDGEYLSMDFVHKTHRKFEVAFTANDDEHPQITISRSK